MSVATYCVHCGQSIETCRCDDVKPSRSVFDLLRAKPHAPTVIKVRTPAEILADVDKALATLHGGRSSAPMITLPKQAHRKLR